jgi:hypothetical protein
MRRTSPRRKRRLEVCLYSSPLPLFIVVLGTLNWPLTVVVMPSRLVTMDTWKMDVSGPTLGSIEPRLVPHAPSLLWSPPCGPLSVYGCVCGELGTFAQVGGPMDPCTLSLLVESVFPCLVGPLVQVMAMWHLSIG